MNWLKTDEYYIGTSNDFTFTKKCACFDLDKTLIDTKSHKKFPIHKDDWIFMYNNIKNILDNLISKGYCIIVISNQLHITKTWPDKLNDIQKELNIPLKVFSSITYNKYRKPLPGFYREFIFNHCKKGFFCGDACGREHDFSDTDYKFALNCKLNFKCPEEIFINQTVIVPPIQYETYNYIKQTKLHPAVFSFTPKDKEIIIMVGYPASGKSFISHMIKQKYNYEIVNQDILKTKSKMMKTFLSLIKQNKSVIIDNTNMTPEKRKQFFVVGYNIRCIYVNSPMFIIKHNNMYRCFKNNIYIPDIVYRKKIIPPEKNEGFDEIIITSCNIPNDDDYSLYLF